VTDLGILMKRSIDGQDVFVQSIATGLPVSDGHVEIIAKNGSTLFTQPTDAQGRAHFLKLDGLTRERAPLLCKVKKAGDLSFLPLNRGDRSLDFSRFDIGGIRSGPQHQSADGVSFLRPGHLSTWRYHSHLA